MKFALLLILLGQISYVQSLAQDTAVYSTVDKPAEFPGGKEKMYKFVAKTLRYPANARRMGIEGKVTIQFVVEIDGALSYVDVANGFDNDCDQEAVRVFKLMPKWIPGEQGGEKVRNLQVVPVAFRLAH